MTLKFAEIKFHVCIIRKQNNQVENFSQYKNLVIRQFRYNNSYTLNEIQSVYPEKNEIRLNFYFSSNRIEQCFCFIFLS